MLVGIGCVPDKSFQLLAFSRQLLSAEGDDVGSSKKS